MKRKILGITLPIALLLGYQVNSKALTKGMLAQTGYGSNPYSSFA
jgi:hypothetical protein